MKKLDIYSNFRGARRFSVIAGLIVALTALSVPVLSGDAGASGSIISTPYTNGGNIAADSAGDLFIANESTSEVYEVVADSGVEVPCYSVNSADAITVGPNNTVYVSSFRGSEIVEITTSCGYVRSYAQGHFYEVAAMAVDSSGNIYFNGSTPGAPIYEITASNYAANIASFTQFSSDNAGNALTIGGNGILYAAQNSAVVEIPLDNPAAAFNLYAVVGSPDFSGIWVSSSGEVYVLDNSTRIDSIDPNGDLNIIASAITFPFYGLAVTPDGNAFFSSTFFHTVFEYANLVPASGGNSGSVTSVSTTRTATTITATFDGTGTSYTCTLLYGFGDASTYSVTTTYNTCSFQGLDPSTTYGIAVMPAGGVFADAVSSFATYTPPPTTTTTTKTSSTPAPPHKTIVCVKGKNVRRVTGTNPHCPAGYKKK